MQTRKTKQYGLLLFYFSGNPFNNNTQKRNIQLDLNNLNSATKCYKIGWILNVIYKSGVPKALNQTPNANLCHFITNSL